MELVVVVWPEEREAAAFQAGFQELEVFQMIEQYTRIKSGISSFMLSIMAGV